MPTSFFDFHETAAGFFLEVPDTTIYATIGTHRLKMTQKMRYGPSTASTWIEIKIICVVKGIKPSYLDLVNQTNKIMKNTTYVIGDDKLTIPFRPF